VTIEAEAAARTAFSAEGLAPTAWSNGPGFRYSAHRHDGAKILFCVEGSITFRTADGDTELRVGDRLDLPVGTIHSAVVGPHGVTCMEAFR
jgi:quercetin dioxygenase-like cupin family protein